MMIQIVVIVERPLEGNFECCLTLTTHWANSADDKFMTFCLSSGKHVYIMLTPLNPTFI